MTQFLKSTLFPNFLAKKRVMPKSAKNISKEEIDILKTRIALLEEENKRASEAITALTDYSKQVAYVIESVVQDVAALAQSIEIIASVAKAQCDTEKGTFFDGKIQFRVAYRFSNEKSTLGWQIDG